MGKVTAFVAAILLLLSTRLHGEDLFLVTARTTTGTPQTLRVGSNNLPDLVTNLIKNEQVVFPISRRRSQHSGGRSTVRKGAMT